MSAAPAPTERRGRTFPTILTLPDGNPGEWTGEHGNAPRALYSVWSHGPTVLATGSGGTVLRSLDDGRSWQRLDSQGTSLLMAVGGFDASHLVLATEEGLLLSGDGGESWSMAKDPIGSVCGIWARGQNLVAVGLEGQILSSSDRGLTSRVVEVTNGALKGVWGSSSERLFAVGGGLGHGPLVFHSNNGGVDWTPRSGTLDPGTSVNGICGTRDGALYAIDARGAVYRSTDDAASWSEVHGIGGREALGIWCDDAGSVYVGGRNRAFTHTDDGGKSWRDTLTEQKKWDALTSVIDGTVLDSGALVVVGEGNYGDPITGSILRRERAAQ